MKKMTTKQYVVLRSAEDWSSYKTLLDAEGLNHPRSCRYKHTGYPDAFPCAVSSTFEFIDRDSYWYQHRFLYPNDVRELYNLIGVEELANED